MAKSIVEKYEQILAADPGSMVFVELAKALIDRGENTRAIDVCKKGLESHADSIVGRVLWGKALLNVGKPDEAMAQFDQATGIDRENPYAYNLIGEVLLHKGLYRSALPVLKKAVQLQPGDGRVRQWLEQVQRQLGELDATAPTADPTRVDGASKKTQAAPTSPSDETRPDVAAFQPDSTLVDVQSQRQTLPPEDKLPSGLIAGLTDQFRALAPDAPLASGPAPMTAGAVPEPPAAPEGPTRELSPAEAAAAAQAAAFGGFGDDAPIAVADRSQDRHDDLTEPAGDPMLAAAAASRGFDAHDAFTDPASRPPRPDPFASAAPLPGASPNGNGVGHAVATDPALQLPGPGDARTEKLPRHDAISPLEPMEKPFDVGASDVPTAKPRAGGPPAPPPLRREKSNPRITPPPPPVKREVTNPRFVLSMLPDSMPPDQQPAVVVQDGPSADEAAQIAAQYEQELRERLLVKKEAPPTFFRKHRLALVAGAALLLVGGGGSATYYYVRLKNRASEVRGLVDGARKGLARDTKGALDEALRVLKDARDLDAKNRDAASLGAEVGALLWHDFGDADAKALAQKLAASGQAGEGAFAARWLLAANDAERRAATEALVTSPPNAGPLVQDLAGQALLAKGDAAGALKRFEAAAKSNPPYLRALADRGDYWREQGNYAQAIEDYDTAKRAHAVHPRSLIGAAEARLAEGKELKEALDDLKSIETTPGATVPGADRLRYEIAYAKLLAATGDRAGALNRLTALPDGLRTRPEVPAAVADVYALSGAHDKAAAEIARAVKLAPRNVAYRETWAKELIALAKFKDVLRATEGFDDRQLHLDRGVARYELGDYEKARTEFDLTRHDNKMPAEAAVYYALTDLALGRKDQARSVIEKLTAARTPHALAYVALGRFEFTEGKLDDAEKDFRLAIERDPSNVEGYCALGRLLVLRGRAKDAVAELTQAANINPFHSEARVALGQAKLDSGDPTGAKNEYDAILQERPSDAGALRGLSAALLALREPAEARHMAERSVRADARNPESWIAVGRAALAQGDDRVATKSLEKARSLAPRNGEVLAMLGEAYLKMGQARPAQKAYEAALKVDDRAAWHVGVGRALLAGRDYRGAARELSAAASSVDKSGDKATSAKLHAALARADLGLGKPEAAKAEKEARLAVKEDDACADAHFALARAVEDKDPSQARQHYEKAANLDPASPEIRFALGALLSRGGGDAARAAQELQEYLRLAPRGPEATQARKLLADARRKSR